MFIRAKKGLVPDTPEEYYETVYTVFCFGSFDMCFRISVAQQVQQPPVVFAVPCVILPCE